MGEAHDDDLRRRRQVQGPHRLRHADPQERGLHVHDEGSRRQHPERRGRCRCARWLRQVPGHVHRLEVGLRRRPLYTQSYKQTSINILPTLTNTFHSTSSWSFYSKMVMRVVTPKLHQPNLTEMFLFKQCY